MATIGLITGANKGLGFEAARQLAQRGIHVLIGARDPEKGEQAATTLCNEGLSASAIAIDVSDEDSVKAAAQVVAEQYGKLDILVNNAGINPEYAKQMFSVEQIPFELFVQIYQTNVFGAFLTIQQFMPLLRKSAAGRIVNISSYIGSLTDQSNPNSIYSGINTIAQILHLSQ